MLSSSPPSGFPPWAPHQPELQVLAHKQWLRRAAPVLLNWRLPTTIISTMKNPLLALTAAVFLLAQGPALAQAQKSEPKAEAIEEETKKPETAKDGGKKPAETTEAAKKVAANEAAKDGKKKVKKGGC